MLSIIPTLTIPSYPRLCTIYHTSCIPNPFPFHHIPSYPFSFKPIIHTPPYPSFMPTSYPFFNFLIPISMRTRITHLLYPHAYHHISLSTSKHTYFLLSHPYHHLHETHCLHDHSLHPHARSINSHACMVLIYTHFSHLSPSSFSKLPYPCIPLILPIPILPTCFH